MLEYKEIFVALLGIFGGVVPYLLQRNKEYRQQLIERKRDAYSKFLEDFSETALAVIHDRETGGIEADKRRITARNQLLLFANDEVISAYDRWFRANNTDGHNTDEEVRLFGKLLVAIRRDIQGASKVNEQQIEGLNPFATG